jgi:hypothetical protein
MLSCFRETSTESVRNRRHRATLSGKHCVTQQPPSAETHIPQHFALQQMSTFAEVTRASPASWGASQSPHSEQDVLRRSERWDGLGMGTS